jgi:hypothetical protein
MRPWSFRCRSEFLRCEVSAVEMHEVGASLWGGAKGVNLRPMGHQSGPTEGQILAVFADRANLTKSPIRENLL